MGKKLTPSQKTARLVYWWLLLGPLVVFPCWAILMYIRWYSRNGISWIEAFLAATVPLLFYLPVFYWAFSPDPFIRVHGRQGLALLGMRYILSLLVSYDTDRIGLLIFSYVIWLIGDIIGLTQAHNHTAWLPIEQIEELEEEEDIPTLLEKFRNGDEQALEQLKARGEVEVF